MIVIVDLGVVLRSGLIKPEEQVFIDELIAHPTVESFAKAILHRLAERDAMNLNYLLNANQWYSKVNILNSRGKKLHNGVDTFLQYFL